MPVTYSPDTQFVIEKVYDTRINKRTKQRETRVKYADYGSKEGGVAWVPTASIDPTLARSTNY